MDEARFWAMIEDGWSAVGAEAARAALLTEEGKEAAAEELDGRSGQFVSALEAALRRLPADELSAFDAILERAMYDIDRKDVHDVLDGSDDGFLYARGFVVAAGRAYYEAVRADPGRGVPDAECEAMCYLSAHVHEKLYGSWPTSGAGISRESVSNAAGWGS